MTTGNGGGHIPVMDNLTPSSSTTLEGGQFFALLGHIFEAIGKFVLEERCSRTTKPRRNWRTTLTNLLHGLTLKSFLGKAKRNIPIGVKTARGLTEKTSVYFFKGEGTDWRMIYNQLSWWDFRPYQDHGWEPPLKTLPLPYSILSFGTDLTRGGMTTRHNPSWTTSTVESTGNGGMRNVSLGSGLIFPRLHSVR
jgi:hypothetical protein